MKLTSNCILVSQMPNSLAIDGTCMIATVRVKLISACECTIFPDKILPSHFYNQLLQDWHRIQSLVQHYNTMTCVVYDDQISTLLPPCCRPVHILFRLYFSPSNIYNDCMLQVSNVHFGEYRILRIETDKPMNRTGTDNR